MPMIATCETIGGPDFLFSMQGIEAQPENKGNLSQSCHTGQMAEMRLATEAARRGFGVFFPIGHSHKADLVIWMPPASPITIQVKKASWQKDGSYKFMIGSGKPSCATNPTNYGLRYTQYAKGDFDYLCAYIAERDCFVFYKLDDIAGVSALRWRPANGQSENNWEIFGQTQNNR